MSQTLPTGLLALPSPGDRTVPKLRRKLALLLLHRLLTHSGEGLPRAFATLQRALPELARAHPKPVRAACANLDFRVSALAGHYDRALPHFLLALARRLPRGAFDDSVIWDLPLSELVDQDTGQVLRWTPPAQGLLMSSTGIEARDAEGAFHDLLRGEVPGEVAFHRLGTGDAGPRLATVDSNPLAMVEAHPGKAGNAMDLGGREAEAWCKALSEALGLIEQTLPDLHSELCESLERVVPVGYQPEMHLSASYLEAPGLIYLTLHPSTLTLAEALIHESQHGKLNLLCWFDPVLENGHSDWAPSPVRPDLRPLHGVLMAVHAFVPVAAMHLRMAEADHPLSHTPHFARRRAEVLGANAAGLATLRERAKATGLGAKVLDALFALHDVTAEAAPEISESATVEVLG